MTLSFRDLPGIEKLLNTEPIQVAVRRFGAPRVKQALRSLQSGWRESGDIPEWAAEPDAYAQSISSRFGHQAYTAVFNLTGTIIHTNLGRSLISESLYQAVEPLVTQPMNLEYDLGSGSRGDREKFVEDRLKLLTGAEAATVVNNGAAALMLVLNTLALGKSVPVSRGELIEIGGSFRLPDLMSRSGAILREVGTTNRTHLKDFQEAIDPDTGLLLKVHPSNYHVGGFTSSVEVGELGKLARERQIPFCVDLGSGTLVDLSRYGLPHEPMPQEALGQGADLVTFSGDKLLGATQAGIVLGRADLVAELKKNPIKRALRPDKLTLAFLEQTLKLYDEPESLPSTLPLLKTLTTELPTLQSRAERIKGVLSAALPDFDIESTDSDCQIGSGSLPDRHIKSIAVTISHSREVQLRELLDRLRELETPVIGRIHQSRIWLDMRGAERLDALAENLEALSL